MAISAGVFRAVMLALLGTGLLVGRPAEGEDSWSQWRGPARDGSAPNGPSRLAKRPSLLWQREVGAGYSGPVVARGRIWTHTRRGELEVVSSFTLEGGELLWSRGYRAPFEQDEAARGHGLGPYATPSLVGSQLVTLGVRAELACWDADSGSLLWKRDYSDEFDPAHPVFGAVASPLVWGDLCFVHFGGTEAGKLGSPGQGAMIALRVEDGEEVWRWTGDSPALAASPVVRTLGGSPQLIFKTRAMIAGLLPQTGEELWRIPFRVPMDNTIVTPLIAGDRLVTSDFDVGISAWQLPATAEGSTPRRLWTTREVSLFMSSPVRAGEQVVGFSNLRRGQLFGLDPKNGTILWRGEPRAGEHASLISWGETLLVLFETGRAILGEVSTGGFLIRQSYQFGDGTWAHPALVDHRLIVKSGENLLVYELGPE